MFFPLMKVPNLVGFLDLLYLAPNSWENKISKSVYLNIIYSNNSEWVVEDYGDLKLMESRRLTTEEFPGIFGDCSLAVIYPSIEPLPKKLEYLPSNAFWYSEIPQWRSTSGFYNSKGQVSYQSEIFPLPSKGTLLSFHPFIQYANLKNYLMVLNLDRDPIKSSGKIEIFDSQSLNKFGESIIYKNSVSLIDLDVFKIPNTSLPVMASRDMAAIPFGLGISHDSYQISLEHTHPPASMVLFGNRLGVQSSIKGKWFQRIYRNDALE